MKNLLIPGFVLALSGAAFAQGDTCSTATAIAGLGSHSLDTTVLTTSAFNGGGSCGAGANTINQDGFYQWTATAAGDYLFDTNGSNFDTKISVHVGVGCAATCVAYDDDGGAGLQSLVGVTGITAGSTYLIQVGGYTTNSGAAILNIGLDPCSGVDDSFENNDSCGAPSPITAGTHAGLISRAADTDFYSISIPAGFRLGVDHTVNNGALMDFRLYDGSCNLLVTKFDDFSYSNAAASPMTLIFEAYPTSTTPTCADYDLAITLAPDPCLGSDDSYEENDDCATAVPIGDGTISGLLISFVDQKDTFSTCLDNGATITVDILFSDAEMDTDLFLWDSSDANCGTGYGTTALVYGYSTTDNESVSYTNNTGAVQNLTIEVDAFAAGTAECLNYDLIVTGSCGTGSNTGTPFCAPMNPNSTGASTTLTGSMGTGVGSGLHLEAGSGPVNQFGYFLIGTGAADPGVVVSQGRLCLSLVNGNVFGRYNVPGGAFNSVGLFNAGGVLMNFVGTSTVGSGFDVPTVVPITGSPSIVAGSTWHFQLWHREAGGASNFSNGLSVNF